MGLRLTGAKVTERHCIELFDRVSAAAHARGVREVEAHISSGCEALTRFANNTIHQNVAEGSRQLSVRVIADGGTARAATNRTDGDSIRDVVEQAIELARAAQPDQELLPLTDPAPYQRVDRWSEATAETSPAERARVVAETLKAVNSAIAAGIFSTEESAYAVLNSRGVCAHHRETMATFSITVLGPDSSGWAKASAMDRGAIDPVALARRASRKAKLSAAPREMPAGRYTVILEPAAVLDLLGQMFADFGATAVEDRRSFLNDRLGRRLFGENISISDDVYHPLQAGAPFDGEGVPRRRVALVERGVPQELVYSRASAHRAGREPTGHGFPLPNEFGEAPINIVIAGGNTSVEQMIASTEQGILVTRLWYIREVDSYQKIMTGMTRDGTFWVQDGHLMHGVRNFRFNQSLVEMLNEVEALAPAERASGEEAFDMVAPAMKVRGLHFTEVTKY